MPSRIVREGIISSDRVEQLDCPAEVFYRRLLNKVDDHGLYDARPSVLRSSLYPLRVDRVKETECAKWLKACAEAGLVVLYDVDGKPYLKVLDTRWHARSEPRFPLPPFTVVNSCAQLQTGEHSCKQVFPVVPVVVDVVVVEDVNNNVGVERAFKQKALEILIYLNEKAGRDYRAVEGNLNLIIARLKEGASIDDCKAVIDRKCEQWASDDRMERFLRPATLFNSTKFAQYQGERSAPKMEIL